VADDESIGVAKQQDRWIYFYGIHPVIEHLQDDLKSSRMFIAQFCVQGTRSHAEIARAFGVHRKSIMRSIRTYRNEGIEGFYRSRKTQSSAAMNPQRLREASELLALGFTLKQVAGRIQVKANMFRKAIEL
jgi:transposase